MQRGAAGCWMLGRLAAAWGAVRLGWCREGGRENGVAWCGAGVGCGVQRFAVAVREIGREIGRGGAVRVVAVRDGGCEDGVRRAAAWCGAWMCMVDREGGRKDGVQRGAVQCGTANEKQMHCSGGKVFGLLG